MKYEIPSYTATWHNTTYPSIDPSQPSLSAQGKTIVVTGAGSGIGRETCLAFAAAGASRISLLGLQIETLTETQALILEHYPATSATVYVTDVTDNEAVRKASSAIGGWDVLILNAASAVDPSPIVEADIDAWWKVMETNVKGMLLFAHHFLPTCHPRAVVINVAAQVVSMPVTPTNPTAGVSAYIVSKMAQVKLTEFISAEIGDGVAISVHPGIVHTELSDKSGLLKKAKPAMDDIKLSAHFLVWAASEEGRFLNGKFCMANWDVSELKAKAGQIQESQLCTSGILGWPFRI
ncbi:hypothetical protein ASPZODRAFT_65269 [Penicilliopsis zonata CBS 506.65]|uniref:Uncharacterized protein n=1 Tax=Penicilliopsis zonata CBS 506.65 TaxID=1073090 RepID=A0A1L9SI02_9EURO|nr:hypothetical protein ASPZODRAFT_65269 [Penicilliopsis zonata CBS 506.65]OJJ46842.1 hypothetical protein ASPZODRAFT_65269 [Penicilliopsis zonata CBS 506.65]